MDDVGNTLSEATVIPRVDGGVAFARLIETVDDVDVFRIDMSEGEVIDFTLALDEAASDLSAGRLTVVDRVPTVLAQAQSTQLGAPVELGFTAPADGSYFLTVDSGELGTGQYILRTRLTQDHADPEGDIPLLALELSDFGTTSHSILTDDVDLFRVDLTAGQRVAFEVDTAMTRGTLTAFTEGGNRVLAIALVENGNPARIEFTAPADGPIFVGFSGVGIGGTTETGSYDLTFSAADPEITVIEPTGDQVFTRTLETEDDADTYAITLLAGQTVELELDATGPTALDVFSRLEIRGPAGDVIDSQSGVFPTNPANIVFGAPEAGIYSVVVRSILGLGQTFETGTYRLIARPDTALRDPEGDTEALALELTGFGVSTHRILNNDDVDFFTIQADPDQLIRVEVRGIGGDPLAQGTLAVGPSGDFLEPRSFVNASGTEQINSTGPDGKVTIYVDGFGTQGGFDVGQYELTVSPITVPDLTVFASTFGTPEPGQTTSLSIFLNNIGPEVQAPVCYRVLLSDDDVFGPSDRVLLDSGPVQVPSLFGTSFLEQVEIPVDLAPGTYMLGVIVDPDDQVAESDESNNVFFFNDFLISSGQPDLVIVDGQITVLDRNGQPFGNRPITQETEFTLSVDVTNLGNGVAEIVPVEFQVELPGLSSPERKSVSFSDRYLAPGETTTLRGNFDTFLLDDIATGQARVTATISPSRFPEESDTTNNAATPLLIDVVNLLEDDHGNDLATATTLTAGDRVTGVVASQFSFGTPDVDVFAFDMPEAGRYRLTVSPDDSLTVPINPVRATLFDPSGVRTSFTGQDGEPVVISGIAATGGTYRIELAGAGLPGAGYAVSFDSLTPDAPDDHADVVAGATALSENVTTAGLIDSRGDIDVFVLDPAANFLGTLRITRTDGGQGISADLTQQLLSIPSEPVLSVSTVTDTLEQTIPVAFSEIITISNFLTISGPVGAYEIEVIRPGPDDPAIVTDFGFGASRDLRGTVGEANIFFMDDGGPRTVIRDFEFGIDKIDVSLWGVESFEELGFENQINRFGDVIWAQILNPSGAVEVAVRFGDGTPRDVAAFGADDFIYAPATARTAGIRQLDTEGFDKFLGVRGSELYELQDDGIRDLIRAFEFDIDQIDVSAFAERFEDLTFRNQTRSDGSVSWVSITDFRGEIEVAVRFGDGTPLDASAFREKDFIYSDVPLQRDQVFEDLPGLTTLNADGTRDTFVMLDDGVRDLIRGFDPTVDLLDVSAFAADFSEISVTNQTRPDGSVSWVQVRDFFGEIEMVLRFDSGALDASRLTADNFIFSDVPIDRAPALSEVFDSLGVSDLRGTSGADRFLLLDDGARDLIRGLDPDLDQLDLSAFGSGPGDVDITTENVLRRDGSVNWVDVFITSTGEPLQPGAQADIRVRFDADTPLDQSSFADVDLIF